MLLLSVFTLNSKTNLLVKFFLAWPPFSPRQSVGKERITGVRQIEEYLKIPKNIFCKYIFWKKNVFEIYIVRICIFGKYIFWQGEDKQRSWFGGFQEDSGKSWGLLLELVEAFIFSCKSLNFSKCAVDIYVKGKVPGKTSISKLGTDRISNLSNASLCIACWCVHQVINWFSFPTSTLNLFFWNGYTSNLFKL